LEGESEESFRERLIPVLDFLGLRLWLSTILMFGWEADDSGVLSGFSSK